MIGVPLIMPQDANYAPPCSLPATTHPAMDRFVPHRNDTAMECHQHSLITLNKH